MKLFLIITNLLFVQFSFVQDGSNNPTPKIWSLEDCITCALENNITVKGVALNTNENDLAASEKEVLRAKARLDAETIVLSDYTEVQSQAATSKYNVIAAITILSRKRY